MLICMRMKRNASRMSDSTSCSSFCKSSDPSLSQVKMWRKSLPSCSSLRQLRGFSHCLQNLNNFFLCHGLLFF